jgi:hypothetical protein
LPKLYGVCRFVPAYFESGGVIDINKLQDRARKAESLSESQQLPTNKRRRVNGAVITKPPVTVSEKDAPEVVTVSDTHAIAGQNVRTPYGKGAVVGSSPTGCKVWWQVSVRTAVFRIIFCLFGRSS